MVITAAHLTPFVAIIAGILILLVPRLLSYIVAIYLIFVGVVELNGVHHWITFIDALRLPAWRCAPAFALKMQCA